MNCIWSSLLFLLFLPTLQAFVPPDVTFDQVSKEDGAPSWEPLEQFRRRLQGGIHSSYPDYDYSTEYISGEVCRFLTAEHCQQMEQDFVSQARNVLRWTQTTPTLKPLVILLEWPNHANRDLFPLQTISDFWNAPGIDTSDAEVYPTGSIRMYISGQSYGQLDIEAHVVDWHVANGTETYFGGGRGGLADEFDETSSLAEAFHFVLDQMEKEGFPFQDYDLDQDQTLDSVIFMHSGYDAANGGVDEDGSSWENRIWSHATSLRPDQEWVSASTGVRLKTFAVASIYRGRQNGKITRLGTPVHEFLHTIGLPDLYDLNGRYGDGLGVGGIGAYGIMSNIAGPGNRQKLPGSLCPWSKMLLGWTKPIEIDSNGTYVARPSNTHKDVFLIQKHYAEGEYLLIENRQPLGIDELLWTGGILIYHIDETIRGAGSRGFPGANNWPSSGKHYKVALLQADGWYELERSENNGERSENNGGEEDFFRFPNQRLQPGNGEDVASNAGTYPNSDSYANGEIRTTGILIDNFVETSTPGTWSFRVSFPDESLPTAAPTVCDYDVLVELQTDKSGSETYWELDDAEGTRLASGGQRTSADPGVELQNEKTYVWSFCVPSGQEELIFTIYDQFGDGMCCDFGSGWWKLSLNGDCWEAVAILKISSKSYSIR